jgi:hypothetical protein
MESSIVVLPVPLEPSNTETRSLKGMVILSKQAPFSIVSDAILVFDVRASVCDTSLLSIIYSIWSTIIKHSLAGVPDYYLSVILSEKSYYDKNSKKIILLLLY